MTASRDKTARIWNVQTGECIKILDGHTDEIFSCCFNYDGDLIITGCKDNAVKLWRAVGV